MDQKQTILTDIKEDLQNKNRNEIMIMNKIDINELDQLKDLLPDYIYNTLSDVLSYDIPPERINKNLNIEYRIKEELKRIYYDPKRSWESVHYIFDQSLSNSIAPEIKNLINKYIGDKNYLVYKREPDKYKWNFFKENVMLPKKKKVQESDLISIIIEKYKEKGGRVDFIWNFDFFTQFINYYISTVDFILYHSSEMIKSLFSKIRNPFNPFNQQKIFDLLGFQNSNLNYLFLMIVDYRKLHDKKEMKYGYHLRLKIDQIAYYTLIGMENFYSLPIRENSNLFDNYEKLIMRNEVSLDDSKKWETKILFYYYYLIYVEKFSRYQTKHLNLLKRAICNDNYGLFNDLKFYKLEYEQNKIKDEKPKYLSIDKIIWGYFLVILFVIENFKIINDQVFNFNKLNLNRSKIIDLLAKHDIESLYLMIDVMINIICQKSVLYLDTMSFLTQVLFDILYKSSPYHNIYDTIKKQATIFKSDISKIVLENIDSKYYDKNERLGLHELFEIYKLGEPIQNPIKEDDIIKDDINDIKKYEEKIKKEYDNELKQYLMKIEQEFELNKENELRKLYDKKSGKQEQSDTVEEIKNSENNLENIEKYSIEENLNGLKSFIIENVKNELEDDSTVDKLKSLFDETDGKFDRIKKYILGTVNNIKKENNELRIDNENLKKKLTQQLQ